MRKMRCKMVATQISSNEYAHGKMHDVKLSAVYSEEEGSENKTYWEATPCGSLDLTNLKNLPEIKVGKEYYVDLILAE